MANEAATADSLADLAVDIVESIDLTEGARERHIASINAERESLGLSPLPPNETFLNDVPDVPACDNCSKEFSGKYSCGKCECAFYCSGECQKAAWSLGGHKQACPQYKAQCQTHGREVVAEMKDDSRPALLRVQRLERLDGAGAYDEAKKNGLHDAIVKLCQEDKSGVLTRFKDGQTLDRAAFVQFIMMTLWRGQRNSRAGSSTIGKCDGGRVKRFVCSSAEAFPALWEACLEVATVPLDDHLYRNDRALHAECHQIARDVLAGFSQIFTNDRASKAILLGPKTKEKDAVVAFAKARLEYLASTLNPIIRKFERAREGRDLRSVLQGYVFQNSAMIEYRAKEYGIEDDFSSRLEMTGETSFLYKTIAVPLGCGTIKKGFALNNEEAQALMRQAAAVMKHDATLKKKKGSGKKGRGRRK